MRRLVRVRDLRLPRRLTLPLLSVLCACGGGGGGGSAVQPASELRAEPAAFAPGDTVTLRPVFAAGSARIEPGVGAVESGRAYVVGPVTADVTFTLVVTKPAGVETVALVVPLRYRERIREEPPSAIARTQHGAVTLPDGRVLLVAGSSSGALNWTNSETYRADDGSFTPVGELSTGRSGPAVAAMPDGTAFVCGGNTNTASFEVATRLEQWDPATLAWSVRGNLRSNRSGHTATALADGRLLVIGGIATGGLLSDRDAEIYQSGAGVRAPANEMLARRTGHTATVRSDGTVLVLGGVRVETGELLATSERFDPVSEQFAPSAPLRHPRTGHTSVRLGDGSILVLGGEDDLGIVATAELWPVDGGAPEAAGDMVAPRLFPRAVLLADGTVLVAGGLLANGQPTDLVEVWAPSTRSWRQWAARLPAPRTGHSLHRRNDGRVVLLGGDPGNGFPVPTCYVLD